jgi:predicted Zn-dependent peptidase
MNAKDLADYLETHVTPTIAIAGDITCDAVVKVLRKQHEDLEYMQNQFDRAIEFLAKCNGWSKRND